jgi:hypothetical protein
MGKKTTPSAPPARPYWVPPEIPFETLPESVQLAFEAIIQPTYHELVLGAADSLERSAGVTLTFLLALEILDQFELGHLLNFSAGSGSSGAAERDKLIARHLRVVGAKQHAAAFLSRIREMRARNELRFGPLRGD